MKYVRAFLMSFSMYCSIPCPIKFWDSENMRFVYALVGFVGCIISLVWISVATLCYTLGVPPLVSAAILTILPWILSGSIHLDGFMDTSDAIFSRRELIRRQEILKDPHVGSFAVINVVMLGLVTLAANYEINLASYILLAPLPIISRSILAVLLQVLKPMNHSQFNYSKSNKTHLILPYISLLFGLLLAVFLGVWSFICAAVCLVSSIAACLLAKKNLAGMSGDIAGFSICIGELCGILSLAILPYVYATSLVFF